MTHLALLQHLVSRMTRAYLSHSVLNIPCDFIEIFLYVPACLDMSAQLMHGTILWCPLQCVQPGHYNVCILASTGLSWNVTTPLGKWYCMLCCRKRKPNWHSGARTESTQQNHQARSKGYWVQPCLARGRLQYHGCVMSTSSSIECKLYLDGAYQKPLITSRLLQPLQCCNLSGAATQS